MGISSGVNGAFFFAICVLLLVAKQHYQSLVRLKRQQTEIIRKLALISARGPQLFLNTARSRLK